MTVVIVIWFDYIIKVPKIQRKARQMMSFGESASSQEPVPGNSENHLARNEVISTLLGHFSRKNFPVDVGKLENLYEDNEALVRAACQIVLDGGVYRDELKELHDKIKQ